MDGAMFSSENIGSGEDSQETAYIPIRILGRGAFGEAVLYRKVEDNSLVVWKEINLQRLGEKERAEAQNEIDILAMLNHANIISYYNHFLDGHTLLIEMEYANGGTLCEKIAAQDKLFPEELVLWFLYQLVSAIAHIHEYGILHRDIKTLNIFLTKTNLAKLGDFGISKILGSSEMAESYVGTPYYMSPELIRGDRYSQPSDIWAAGCVLYELLTLKKVFDATNPLKLAHDIVQCEVSNQISTTYSEQIRSLVNQMLKKEADLRPTAEDILKTPLISEKASSFDQKIWELNSGTRRAKILSTASSDVLPVVTSKSSEVFIWGGGKVTPQNIELFTKARAALQVSTGKCHFAVVTVEKELYTWANPQGADIVGQLGHKDIAAYKAPKKVEALEGMSIEQVSCGEDFTICVTDNGTLYGFGSDYFGCLGCDNKHGDKVLAPITVDHFSSNPVQQVSCGDAHVIALTQSGEVYTWGSGEFGRLGLGSEDDYSTPQKVATRGRHGIYKVCAGSEGSFLIKQNGRVLACGSNEHNKLGFNSSAKGLKRTDQLSYDIPCKYTFTTVKPLSKYNIVSMATGKTHSAAVDCFGHLVMFGCNRYGQLGLGDCRPHNGVFRISGPLTGKIITKVACGDGFTVAATKDNQIYSWGLAENGRLGTTHGDSYKTDGSCVSPLPRPIFGSLHVVSDVACQHWNTILVAEKVLAQKTIRSTSCLSASSKEADPQTDSTEEEPFRFNTGVLEDGSSCHKVMAASLTEESNVPGWLQAELADSEFIPASADASGNEQQIQTNGPLSGDPVVHNCQHDPDLQKKQAESSITESSDQLQFSQLQIQNSMTESLRNELESQYPVLIAGPSAPSASQKDANSPLEGALSSEEVAGLWERIRMLEAENAKLQELVYHQAETIRTQATTIAHLEDKYKFQQEIQNEIWEVVETWQREWYEAMGRADQPPDVTNSGNRSAGNQRAANRNRNLQQQDSSATDDVTDVSAITSATSSRQESMDASPGCQDNASDASTERAGSDRILDWNNLGSPDEIRTWSRSNRTDMLKSYSPGKMMQSLKGVTTTEEML